MRWVLAIALLVTVWPGQLVAAQLTSAEAILNCAANNAPAKSFRQAAELRVLDNGRLARRIQARFAGLGGDKGFRLNIGVTEPVDVAGTAVLLRQRPDRKDDLRLYLPSLRRSRQLSGNMAAQGVLGTDFSYADIMQVYGAFSRRQAEVLEPQPWRERAAYRLELEPLADDAGPAPYRRLRLAIDQETCVTLLVEFYDQNDVLSKRLEGDWASVIQLKQRHLLLRYLMSDLQVASQTQLLLGLPVIDEAIARTAFNPNTFQQYHNPVPAPEQ